MAGAVDYTVQGSMFEGLYQRVLKPTGAFKEQLRTAGYDVDRPEPVYPVAVWVACLDVSWHELFPTLERFAAWEQIGEAFIAGFLETLIGKMITVVFPLISPTTLVTRAPRFIKTGLREVETQVEWLGPTEAKITLVGPHDGGGHVLVGAARIVLRRFGIAPTLTCIDLPGMRSILHLRWDAP